jgi:hypothetical protein
MDNVVKTVKTSIGGLFAVLTSVIGLLVLAQVVLAGMNVISNLQAIVNGFVGEGASLAGLITLLLIVGLLQKQTTK